MEALNKLMVHRGKPTDYFRRQEFSKILETTYKYEYGAGNDCRFRKDLLRALLLVMRWSGISIKDAVTLERNRFEAKGSLLLRGTKTGVPVRFSSARSTQVSKRSRLTTIAIRSKHSASTITATRQKL